MTITINCDTCEHKKNGNCDSETSWINCCLLGNHLYSEIECKCGHVYCWDCAGSNGDNPYGGGCYRSCPECGQVISDNG